MRRCIVELQEFERGIDPAMPRGEAMADAYLRRLLGRCRRFRGAIFVAEHGGEIVGLAGVLGRLPVDEPDDDPRPWALLSDLVVRDGRRGLGIGRRLLRAAEAHARACGVARLRVGVLARNTRARRLYRSDGFAEHELFMEKPLARRRSRRGARGPRRSG